MIASSATANWPTYTTTATLTWWGQLDGISDALAAVLAPAPGVLFLGAKPQDSSDWIRPTVVVTYKSPMQQDDAQDVVADAIESVAGSVFGQLSTMIQTVATNAAADTATTVNQLGGVASDAWGGIQVLAIAAAIVGAAYVVAMLRGSGVRVSQ